MLLRNVDPKNISRKIISLCLMLAMIISLGFIQPNSVKAASRGLRVEGTRFIMIMMKL